jgi:linoleoyl-CoA desaturase
VLSKWETFVFWGGKAGLFLVRFVIPYYLIGNISVVMRQFFLPIIVASYCMEFIFIVNHNLSEAHINLPSESTDPTKKVHWADAQVITTSNWRSSSKFFNYLAGGLNHQIEHHIFPGMYFAYYWQISPIVEQVCKKHGLPYHTYPTYSSILYSCLNHLYKLGTFDKNPDDKQKSQ